MIWTSFRKEKKQSSRKPETWMRMSSVFCLRCKTTEVKNELIRYFDMFAGIGGFRAGLTRAGGFQCVGHCEIDKYADASYRAIHDIGEEECYYPDAREIDPGGMPDFDLLCGGFPCQSYSMAGHRLGFADPRGALFFEIARLAEAKRPSYLLLENVPGLLSHDQGRTFAAILSTLGDLGYHVEWSVLNSALCAATHKALNVKLIIMLSYLLKRSKASKNTLADFTLFCEIIRLKYIEFCKLLHKTCDNLTLCAQKLKPLCSNIQIDKNIKINWKVL